MCVVLSRAELCVIELFFVRVSCCCQCRCIFLLAVVGFSAKKLVFEMNVMCRVGREILHADC